MILTTSSPGNSQMTFIIGEGFAEVHMLIKLELTSLTFWNIWIIFCIHVDIDKLQPKILTNFIFHTMWSRLCWNKKTNKQKNKNKKKTTTTTTTKTKKNKKKMKLVLTLELCEYFDKMIKFCIHIDNDNI